MRRAQQERVDGAHHSYEPYSNEHHFPAPIIAISATSGDIGAFKYVFLRFRFIRPCNIWRERIIGRDRFGAIRERIWASYCCIRMTSREQRILFVMAMPRGSDDDDVKNPRLAAIYYHHSLMELCNVSVPESRQITDGSSRVLYLIDACDIVKAPCRPWLLSSTDCRLVFPLLLLGAYGNHNHTRSFPGLASDASGTPAIGDVVETESLKLMAT